MSITWSTDELDKIKKQSLKELRPSYYYLPTKNLMQISEDMEGYLILQNQEQKQKLLAWIKKVSKIEAGNKDRDELLATYLAARNLDCQDKISEIDEYLNDYSEMQAELITDGNDSSRFATIMDLNLMTRSISRQVDNLVLQRDQAYHEDTISTLLTNLLNANKSDSDTEKELNSWQTVLSAYKGQTSKSGKVGVASQASKT